MTKLILKKKFDNFNSKKGYLEKVINETKTLLTSINETLEINKNQKKDSNILSSLKSIQENNTIINNNFKIIVDYINSIRSNNCPYFEENYTDYLINPFIKDSLLIKAPFFMKYLFYNKQTDFTSINNEDNSSIILILKCIDESLFDENFNVNILSKKTGYNKKQLIKIINKNTNLTPVKLILKFRLDKAKDLLNNSNNITIKEVQFNVGINSASYFSKKFKSQFGISPSKFYLTKKE